MTQPKGKATSNNNTNTLYNKYSMYVAGGTSERANNHLEWFERTIFERDSTDIVYVVENIYVGRLDWISSVFYKETRWWWVIAAYNNILDPFSEVVAGTTLLIPAPERLPLILKQARGGKDSTRQPANTISPIIS